MKNLIKQIIKEEIEKLSEARFDTTSIKEMLSMVDSLKGKTLIWFDTETSGLKFNRPLQFTQLAAVSTDSDGNTIDTFNEKVKLNPRTKKAYDKSSPENPASIRRALDINKYFDSITGEEREEVLVLKDFVDWVLSHSNPILIAYNISFDLEILNTISPTKLRFFTLDVMKIAQYFWIPLHQYLAKQGDEQSQLIISKLGRGRRASLPGSKLSVIASVFNLDTSNAHDALGDIIMMKDVFANMIDELKQYKDFNLPYHTRIDRISVDKRTKETEKKQLKKTNLRDRKFRKKYRKQVDEALRDELPDYMINAVKKNNPNLADKFLDMDVPQHTELIPNVKIELNEPSIKKEFVKEIQNYFGNSIEKQFKKTKLFNIIIQQIEDGYNFADMFSYFLPYPSREYEFYNKNKWEKISVIIKNLKFLYSKDFPLLQSKDNNDVFNPIFSNNKSNLFTFIKTFNNAFPNEAIDLNAIMNDKIFVGLREPIMNFEQNVKDLVNSKLYLYITDKPADVLRMSVSNFYSSCQNLYTGVQNDKLLANVFDKNSKIAYLIFDSPYVDNQGNKHPFTPIARTIIRVGENNQILFDKTYPKPMENDFYNILEKYTELKDQGTGSSKYPYEYIGLPSPYMDRYKMKTIGGSDLEDNPRAVALADELNIDIKEIEQESDVTFSYYNQKYKIYTLEEANEYTRDDFRDNWTEYIGDTTSFYNLVTRDILNKDRVYSTLNINDEYLAEQGMNFEKFLKEIGIESIWDFNQYLSKNGYSSYWQWYREGVTYNLDKVIRYFGGMDEARTIALASYDGYELYNAGYYIYRTD